MFRCDRGCIATVLCPTHKILQYVGILFDVRPTESISIYLGRLYTILHM